MASLLATIAVGLVSGVLSGVFGIGGGLVTTPAIRLLLGFPALIAVGTPLPVIVPGAITGALAYRRRGLADVRAGLIMGAIGSIGSVAGALASQRAGGTVVLLSTSVLIAWAAIDMLLQHKRADAAAKAFAAEEGAVEVGISRTENAVARPPLARLVLIGALAGLYSGFLGLGGGFIVVPGLTRFAGMSVKRAIGTSLVTVAVLAVPGTIAHSLLGHVDWSLALLLAIGVVPGAMIGARATEHASDRSVRLAFALLLAVVGIWLAASEIAGLGL